MNLPIEKQLPDNAFWKYFLLICSIPHPSEHEDALRSALIAEAGKHHLQCRVDAAGNLAIDRPAARGFENNKRIILQAHLDMVPQVAPGVDFDFLRDAVVPQVEGNWVTTGGRTTLGADDGMGVALAMELLTDPALECGALRGVFTVCEETGLGGAEDIDADFLDADYLINLDSDAPFTIGCAGGARLTANRSGGYTAVSPGKTGVRFTLKGMHGGHSGVDIHLNVGSATVVMGRFIQGISGFELASVQAGTLHNAIAREAAATGAVDAEKIPALEALAAQYSEELNKSLIHNPGDRIVLGVELLPEAPAQVLTAAAQAELLTVWNALPHGLLAKTTDGSSQTSSNLAVVNGSAGSEWNFTLLVRSLYDSERDAVAGQALELLRRNGFAAGIDSAYSAWAPQYDSGLLDYACGVYQELYGQEARKFVVHGGLEPGIFCGMKPALQMISFAPMTEAIHSPQEKLNIADCEKSRGLLRALVSRIGECN